MRDNQPITQREFDFPDNATLMSTTDTLSHITDANDAFIAMSGYSREDIHGQPHTLVRHSDMPCEAFADMWATLKGGEPWTALVKNRRKSGDHCWVRANAMPVTREGRTVGYMSVRTKPSRDDIAAAQGLYKDFREGRAGGRRFFKGLIVSNGLFGAANGGRAVSQVVTLMDEITHSSKKIADHIAENSSSTAEQSDGITQVGQAMGHLDEITQQNAALVEKCSAASEGLRQQMQRLAEAVGVFR